MYLKQKISPEGFRVAHLRNSYPIEIKRKSTLLIQTVEEISEKICKKEIFTVLDLKYGYWHVELDEQPSYLCT